MTLSDCNNEATSVVCSVVVNEGNCHAEKGDGSVGLASPGREHKWRGSGEYSSRGDDPKLMRVQKFERVGLRFCCSGKMFTIRVLVMLAEIGQLVVFGFVLSAAGRGNVDETWA